jgi:hypothetical protein
VGRAYLMFTVPHPIRRGAGQERPPATSPGLLGNPVAAFGDDEPCTLSAFIVATMPSPRPFSPPIVRTGSDN